MDDQRTNREGGSVRLKRFRFSLKTLLVVVTAFALIASAYWAGRGNGFRHGYIKASKEADSKWQALQQEAEIKHRERMDLERKLQHDAAEEYVTQRSREFERFFSGRLKAINKGSEK